LPVLAVKRCSNAPRQPGDCGHIIYWALGKCTKSTIGGCSNWGLLGLFQRQRPNVPLMRRPGYKIVNKTVLEKIRCMALRNI